MSKESAAWLNNNVLVGCTDKRGHAWHYKASEQGSESNHYPEFIPVADVLRRLFNFQLVERELYVSVPTVTNLNADTPDAEPFMVEGSEFVALEGRKAIARSDNNAVLGLFKGGYQIHQYQEWLLGNVANILSDELNIGSAGLLAQGGQAWVQVEALENVTDEVTGMAFRPNLLATTSADGTIATTYKRTVTVVVCDNTRECALNEKGQTYKVKHSKYSHLKLESAKDALGIISTLADDFTAELHALAQYEVSTQEWDDFLTALVPIDEDSKRSVTVGQNKRDAIHAMYSFDERASAWKGTALGVLQATNTFNHHGVATRGETVRAERNMSEAIKGNTAKADAAALDLLVKVTGRELVLS